MRLLLLGDSLVLFVRQLCKQTKLVTFLRADCPVSCTVSRLTCCGKKRRKLYIFINTFDPLSLNSLLPYFNNSVVFSSLLVVLFTGASSKISSSSDEGWYIKPSCFLIMFPSDQIPC